MSDLELVISSIKQIFREPPLCTAIAQYKIYNLKEGRAKRFGFTRAVLQKPAPNLYIVAGHHWSNSPPAEEQYCLRQPVKRQTVSTSHVDFEIARQRRTPTKFRVLRRHQARCFSKIFDFLNLAAAKY